MNGLIEMAPRLYVGGYRAAQRARDYHKICVSDSRYEAKFAHSHYPIDEDDLPSTFVRYARKVAYEAITKLQDGHRVLIYCHAGRNRSVSCVLYLLVKYSDLTLSEARDRIEQLHPDALIMDEIMDFLEYRFNKQKL